MTEFTDSELRAIKELADFYLDNGGLDVNLPADLMGTILVASVRDKAEQIIGADPGPDPGPIETEHTDGSYTIRTPMPVLSADPDSNSARVQ